MPVGEFGVPVGDYSCAAARAWCQRGNVKANPGVHVFNTVIYDRPGARPRALIQCHVDVRRRAPTVQAADVRAWLVKRIPVGVIGATGAKTLVNVDAVLWLTVQPMYQWGPVTVVQPGVRIRVRLDHVRWDFGDGVSDDAPDAGRPYDSEDPCGIRCPQYFGHAYTVKKGPMTLRATGYWIADFSVNGGAWQMLPQLVPAAPAPNRRLTVVEARSQLVSND